MSKELTKNLMGGVLYLWNPYLYSPKALDTFEAIQELVIDIDVPLVENPDHGFVFYLSAYKALFPEPGEDVSIYLDQRPAKFQLRDIDITVTYSSSNGKGKLDMEARREVQRVALPANEAAKQTLLQWIGEHHNLDDARNIHRLNLENPRFLNKNKPLRLSAKISGNPKARRYHLQRGFV